MDRLQEIAFERRAAEPDAGRLTLWLFAGFALLLVGLAALRMVILSLKLFPPREAGLVLAVAAICGVPAYFLGRRQARRR